MECFVWQSTAFVKISPDDVCPYLYHTESRQEIKTKIFKIGLFAVTRFFILFQFKGRILH